MQCRPRSCRRVVGLSSTADMKAGRYALWYSWRLYHRASPVRLSLDRQARLGSRRFERRGKTRQDHATFPPQTQEAHAVVARVNAAVPTERVKGSGRFEKRNILVNRTGENRDENKVLAIQTKKVKKGRFEVREKKIASFENDKKAFEKYSASKDVNFVSNGCENVDVGPAAGSDPSAQVTSTTKAHMAERNSLRGYVRNKFKDSNKSSERPFSNTLSIREGPQRTQTIVPNNTSLHHKRVFSSEETKSERKNKKAAKKVNLELRFVKRTTKDNKNERDATTKEEKDTRFLESEPLSFFSNESKERFGTDERNNRPKFHKDDNGVTELSADRICPPFPPPEEAAIKGYFRSMQRLRNYYKNNIRQSRIIEIQCRTFLNSIFPSFMYQHRVSADAALPEYRNETSDGGKKLCWSTSLALAFLNTAIFFDLTKSYLIKYAIIFLISEGLANRPSGVFSCDANSRTNEYKEVVLQKIYIANRIRNVITMLNARSENDGKENRFSSSSSYQDLNMNTVLYSLPFLFQFYYCNVLLPEIVTEFETVTRTGFLDGNGGESNELFSVMSSVLHKMLSSLDDESVKKVDHCLSKDKSEGCELRYRISTDRFKAEGLILEHIKNMESLPLTVTAEIKDQKIKSEEIHTSPQQADSISSMLIDYEKLVINFYKNGEYVYLKKINYAYFISLLSRAAEYNCSKYSEILRKLECAPLDTHDINGSSTARNKNATDKKINHAVKKIRNFQNFKVDPLFSVFKLLSNEKFPFLFYLKENKAEISDKTDSGFSTAHNLYQKNILKLLNDVIFPEVCHLHSFQISNLTTIFAAFLNPKSNYTFNNEENEGDNENSLKKEDFAVDDVHLLHKTTLVYIRNYFVSHSEESIRHLTKPVTELIAEMSKKIDYCAFNDIFSFLVSMRKLLDLLKDNELNDDNSEKRMLVATLTVFLQNVLYINSSFTVQAYLNIAASFLRRGYSVQSLQTYSRVFLNTQKKKRSASAPSSHSYHLKTLYEYPQIPKQTWQFIQCVEFCEAFIKDGSVNKIVEARQCRSKAFYTPFGFQVLSLELCVNPSFEFLFQNSAKESCGWSTYSSFILQQSSLSFEDKVADVCSAFFDSIILYFRHLPLSFAIHGNDSRGACCNVSVTFLAKLRREILSMLLKLFSFDDFSAAIDSETNVLRCDECMQRIEFYFQENPPHQQSILVWIDKLITLLTLIASKHVPLPSDRDRDSSLINASFQIEFKDIILLATRVLHLFTTPSKLGMEQVCKTQTVVKTFALLATLDQDLISNHSKDMLCIVDKVSGKIVGQSCSKNGFGSERNSTNKDVGQDNLEFYNLLEKASNMCTNTEILSRLQSMKRDVHHAMVQTFQFGNFTSRDSCDDCLFLFLKFLDASVAQWCFNLQCGQNYRQHVSLKLFEDLLDRNKALREKVLQQITNKEGFQLKKGEYKDGQIVCVSEIGDIFLFFYFLSRSAGTVEDFRMKVKHRINFGEFAAQIHFMMYCRDHFNVVVTTSGKGVNRPLSAFVVDFDTYIKDHLDSVFTATQTDRMNSSDHNTYLNIRSYFIEDVLYVLSLLIHENTLYRNANEEEADHTERTVVTLREFLHRFALSIESFEISVENKNLQKYITRTTIERVFTLLISLQHNQIICRDEEFLENILYCFFDVFLLVGIFLKKMDNCSLGIEGALSKYNCKENFQVFYTVFNLNGDGLFVERSYTRLVQIMTVLFNKNGDKENTDKKTVTKQMLNDMFEYIHRFKGQNNQLGRSEYIFRRNIYIRNKKAHFLRDSHRDQSARIQRFTDNMQSIFAFFFNGALNDSKTNLFSHSSIGKDFSKVAIYASIAALRAEYSGFFQSLFTKEAVENRDRFMHGELRRHDGDSASLDHLTSARATTEEVFQIFCQNFENFKFMLMFFLLYEKGIVLIFYPFCYFCVLTLNLHSVLHFSPHSENDERKEMSDISALFDSVAVVRLNSVHVNILVSGHSPGVSSDRKKENGRPSYFDKLSTQQKIVLLFFLDRNVLDAIRNMVFERIFYNSSDSFHYKHNQKEENVKLQGRWSLLFLSPINLDFLQTYTLGHLNFMKETAQLLSFVANFVIEHTLSCEEVLKCEAQYIKTFFSSCTLFQPITDEENGTLKRNLFPWIEGEENYNYNSLETFRKFLAKKRNDSASSEESFSYYISNTTSVLYYACLYEWISRSYEILQKLTNQKILDVDRKALVNLLENDVFVFESREKGKKQLIEVALRCFGDQNRTEKEVERELLSVVNDTIQRINTHNSREHEERQTGVRKTHVFLDLSPVVEMITALENLQPRNVFEVLLEKNELNIECIFGEDSTKYEDNFIRELPLTRSTQMILSLLDNVKKSNTLNDKKVKVMNISKLLNFRKKDFQITPLGKANDGEEVTQWSLFPRFQQKILEKEYRIIQKAVLDFLFKQDTNTNIETSSSGYDSLNRSQAIVDKLQMRTSVVSLLNAESIVELITIFAGDPIFSSQTNLERCEEMATGQGSDFVLYLTVLLEILISDGLLDSLGKNELLNLCLACISLQVWLTSYSGRSTTSIIENVDQTSEDKLFTNKCSRIDNNDEEMIVLQKVTSQLLAKLPILIASDLERFVYAGLSLQNVRSSSYNSSSYVYKQNISDLILFLFILRYPTILYVLQQRDGVNLRVNDDLKCQLNSSSIGFITLSAVKSIKDRFLHMVQQNGNTAKYITNFEMALEEFEALLRAGNSKDLNHQCPTVVASHSTEIDSLWSKFRSEEIIPLILQNKQENRNSLLRWISEPENEGEISASERTLSNLSRMELTQQLSVAAFDEKVIKEKPQSDVNLILIKLLIFLEHQLS